MIIMLLSIDNHFAKNTIIKDKCSCDVELYLNLTTRQYIISDRSNYIIIRRAKDVKDIMDTLLYYDNFCMYVLNNTDTYLIFYTNERLFDFKFDIKDDSILILNFYPFTIEYYLGFIYPQETYFAYFNSFKVEYYLSLDTFLCSYISYRWIWSDLVNSGCEVGDKELCYMSLLHKYYKNIDSLFFILQKENLEYDSLWNLVALSVRIWAQYVSILLAYSEGNSNSIEDHIVSITNKVDSIFNIVFKIYDLKYNGDFWWAYESFKVVKYIIYFILEIQIKETSLNYKLRIVNDAFVKICEMSL